MFEALDLTMPVIGYIVMRIGMVAFWLISSRSDRHHAKTARLYAAGIGLVQVYWTVALVLLRPAADAAVVALFLLGVVLEMLVPAVAERKGVTPWHRHHMMERHGLFTIIVLGEVLLSGASAIAASGEAHGGSFQLAALAVSALAITFSMWWLYFSQEGPLDQEDFGSAFRWGYLHSAIYASGAAVGAGFAVVVDTATGHAHAGALTGNLAVAVPLAVYLAALWHLRDRLVLMGPGRFVLLPFAFAVLGAGFLGPLVLPAMAVLVAASVVVRSRMTCREA
jgi:low temperature requirement protein LtrA